MESLLKFPKGAYAFKMALACAVAAWSLHAQAAVPIVHWTLPNGAKVYLAETDALPIVDVQIDFDAGSRRDPADQAGLASVTAGMIEKGVRADGSAPAMDENALGEAWADLGASFDAGASLDRMSFTLRSLARPALLGKAVALAARQIGEPAFPEDVWQRERERLNASIREANTKPATIAGRAFRQAVYGTHPYGQEATETTLAKIDMAAVRVRYAQLVQPCRAKLSIVGAVTRAQAERIATELLSRLPAGDGRCEPLPPLPEVAPLAGPKEERTP